MRFTDDNRKERMMFVDLWAKYVLGHDDADWSRQQNVIINSCMRTADITKEAYLRMKGEKDIKK